MKIMNMMNVCKKFDLSVVRTDNANQFIVSNKAGQELVVRISPIGTVNSNRFGGLNTNGFPFMSKKKFDAFCAEVYKNRG